MQESYSPPTTVLDVPVIQFKLSSDNLFRSDVRMMAYEGPSITNLKVDMYGVDESNKILIRSFIVRGIPSGQMPNVAGIKVQKPPKHILVCLTGKNSQGASINQRLLLAQDDSIVYATIIDQLVTYASLPIADLPTKPVCS